MSALRIVFAGTPEFGIPCLNAIVASSHQLLAVYTQPDRPAGRGQQTHYSGVKQWALEHHIPIYQPLNFKDPHAVSELAALKPDVLVVIAYGLILPKTVLTIPTFGCINVHASLLPRWRGASPIQQAILHGDAETGVTIMKMDVGLDTGPVSATVHMQLTSQHTAGMLHDELSHLAIEPLLNTLNHLFDQQTVFTPQDSSLATYAPKIKKEDALIDWKMPAEVIDRQIRAFVPWPIARTMGHGDVLRIHQAHVVYGQSNARSGHVLSIDKHGMLVATGRDQLCIDRIQFPGGKVMSVADWMHGGHAASFIHVDLA